MTCYELYFKVSFCLLRGEQTGRGAVQRSWKASEEAAGSVSSKRSDGLARGEAVP